MPAFFYYLTYFTKILGFAGWYEFEIFMKKLGILTIKQMFSLSLNFLRVGFFFFFFLQK